MSAGESVLLAKAAAALDQAHLLLGARHFDGAADRAYYAMFHAASALLARDGMGVTSHRGLLAAFGKAYAKAGRIDPRFHRMLLNAFDPRQTADYSAATDIGAETSGRACQEAGEFLQMARRELGAAEDG